MKGTVIDVLLKNRSDCYNVYSFAVLCVNSNRDFVFIFVFRHESSKMIDRVTGLSKWSLQSNREILQSNCEVLQNNLPILMVMLQYLTVNCEYIYKAAAKYCNLTVH